MFKDELTSDQKNIFDDPGILNKPPGYNGFDSVGPSLLLSHRLCKSVALSCFKRETRLFNTDTNLEVHMNGLRKLGPFPFGSKSRNDSQIKTSGHSTLPAFQTRLRDGLCNNKVLPGRFETFYSKTVKRGGQT